MRLLKIVKLAFKVLLIIKYIRDRNISLVFTSSSEVYGTKKEVPFKEDSGIIGATILA